MTVGWTIYFQTFAIHASDALDALYARGGEVDFAKKFKSDNGLVESWAFATQVPQDQYEAVKREIDTRSSSSVISGSDFLGISEERRLPDADEELAELIENRKPVCLHCRPDLDQG